MTIPVNTTGTNFPVNTHASNSNLQPSISNADIMAKLNDMMSCMVVKNDMDKMEQRLIMKIKENISEAIDPVKDELNDVKEDIQQIDCNMENICTRINVLEKRPENTDMATLSQKIKDIENKMHAMGQTSPDGTTMVMGGLNDFENQEAATTWVQEKLNGLNIKKYMDIYAKGQFKGLLFIKFGMQADRTNAIEKFRQAKLQYSGKMIWAKPEQAVDMRVCESYLFALKKILVSWGYTASEVKVEIDTPCKFLQINGEKVVTITAKDNKIDLIWAPD